MAAEDAPHVYDIERFIGQAIPRVKVEGFAYQYTALFDQQSSRAGAAAGRPSTARGVRLKGGYYFGPARRRRR
jgi:hypothetical protein